MYVIDSHCHLNFSRFKEVFAPVEYETLQENHLDNVIKRAHDAGVKYMLTIGTELADIIELQSITNTYQNVFRTVGIHPQEAKRHLNSYSCDKISAIIKENCVMPKTVGIGEIGLDYHYGKDDEKEQKELFHLQLGLAEKFNLPVSIHSRDAQDDTIAILREHPRITGVLHCFSGEPKFAEEALKLGLYISISGVITYKKTQVLQETVKQVPLDRLLIETDAPFLAPVPFRGKINEPAYVVHVAEKIADILGTSVEKIADITSKNFFNLFRKAMA